MAENNRVIGRRWGIALPVSIVLNLFLVALIGGHVWRERMRPINTEPLLARALANIEARLPPQDAATFLAVLKRDAPNYDDDQKKLAEARRVLARQIATEPFEAEQVRQDLTAWSAAWNRFFAAFSDTLVDALGQISPEGRRKLIAERRPNR